MAIPAEWLEQARYDVETARAMLAAGRYLYVLFCCQQAVEKALKSVVAARTGEMPPRLHNLMTLAEKAQIQPNEAQAEWLRRLTNYYIRSRYPEESRKLSTGATNDLATEALRETEALMQWLSPLTK